MMARQAAAMRLCSGVGLVVDVWRRKELHCRRTDNAQAGLERIDCRCLFVCQASQRQRRTLVAVNNSMRSDCLSSNYWRMPVADSQLPRMTSKRYLAHQRGQLFERLT